MYDPQCTGKVFIAYFIVDRLCVPEWSATHMCTLTFIVSNNKVYVFGAMLYFF